MQTVRRVFDFRTSMLAVSFRVKLINIIQLQQDVEQSISDEFVTRNQRHLQISYFRIESLYHDYEIMKKLWKKLWKKFDLNKLRVYYRAVTRDDNKNQFISQYKRNQHFVFSISFTTNIILPRTKTNHSEMKLISFSFGKCRWLYCGSFGNVALNG